MEQTLASEAIEMCQKLIKQNDNMLVLIEAQKQMISIQDELIASMQKQALARMVPPPSVN